MTDQYAPRPSAAKPNVYGWMLARHFAISVLKVPRVPVRIRVTVQVWRPWRSDD